MKKSYSVFICILVAVLSFVAGYGTKAVFSKYAQEETAVGIYFNDNWNGKDATLTLNEDSTCIYPSGGRGTWTQNEDVIEIKIEYDFGTSDIKATLVDNGIVLYNHFFEKLN